MISTDWIPGDVVVDKPSPARIYDYLLGGYHNFEADRLLAEKAIQIYPDMRLTAMANRAFLRRVVKFLVRQGIDQFLDIGSGIPTVGNVHEVAQAANPDACVVYVDIDPIAIAHSEVILRDNPRACAIRADARQPERLLDHVEVKRLLDFSRPVAVLLIAFLHLVPDDAEAYSLTGVLRDAVTPGSYIAVAHGTYESALYEIVQQLQALGGGSMSPYAYRTRAQIEPFFGAFELVEPGLVHVPLWQPEGPDDVMLEWPERSLNLGGVARKPEGNQVPHGGG